MFAYQTVSDHRNNIILRSNDSATNPKKPVVVYVPYAHHVQRTFSIIMGTITHPSTEDFPLKFQIADGLYGSGSHTIYNQQNNKCNYEDFYTFLFQANANNDLCYGVTLWKNKIPYSHKSLRPIFHCAEKVNE